MTDYILAQLAKTSYVMFKDGWSSKEVAPIALMEIASLRQKIERLEKALETAREALEPFAEAHPMGDEYVKFHPSFIVAARTVYRTLSQKKED